MLSARSSQCLCKGQFDDALLQNINLANWIVSMGIPRASLRVTAEVGTLVAIVHPPPDQAKICVEWSIAASVHGRVTAQLSPFPLAQSFDALWIAVTRLERVIQYYKCIFEVIRILSAMSWLCWNQSYRESFQLNAEVCISKNKAGKSGRQCPDSQGATVSMRPWGAIVGHR